MFFIVKNKHTSSQIEGLCHTFKPMAQVGKTCQKSHTYSPAQATEKGHLERTRFCSLICIYADASMLHSYNTVLKMQKGLPWENLIGLWNLHLFTVLLIIPQQDVKMLIHSQQSIHTLDWRWSSALKRSMLNSQARPGKTTYLLCFQCPYDSCLYVQIL